MSPARTSMPRGQALLAELLAAHWRAGGVAVVATHQALELPAAHCAIGAAMSAAREPAFAGCSRRDRPVRRRAARRDLRLALRRSGDTLQPLGFFLVVTTLFPLGIGPAAVAASRHRAGCALGRGAVILAAGAGPAVS